MLALRHGARFFGDLFAYCWTNEVWWPLPVVFVLLSVGFLALTTQVATPYIYTLF
jgi:hypothetical protein